MTYNFVCTGKEAYLVGKLIFPSPISEKENILLDVTKPRLGLGFQTILYGIGFQFKKMRQEIS